MPKLPKSHEHFLIKTFIFLLHYSTPLLHPSFYSLFHYSSFNLSDPQFPLYSSSSSFLSSFVNPSFQGFQNNRNPYPVTGRHINRDLSDNNFPFIVFFFFLVFIIFIYNKSIRVLLSYASTSLLLFRFFEELFLCEPLFDLYLSSISSKSFTALPTFSSLLTYSKNYPQYQNNPISSNVFFLFFLNLFFLIDIEESLLFTN
jgi:hypothetical protein